MSEDHDHGVVEGPWAGGWLVAAAAGMGAALIARIIGEADLTAGVAVGGVTFAVFGVLLGSGGVELGAADHGESHDAGAHH
jgi:hypothetical protein